MASDTRTDTLAISNLTEMEDAPMTTPATTTTPETQPAPVAMDAVTTDASATPAPAPVEPDAQVQPPQKKRKADRRDKLKKTALCKHFDKPGGCPFPNCRFAHGRDEQAADETSALLAVQRKFLREQVKTRTEGRYKQSEGSGSTAVFARRGTMIERYYTQLFACDVMGKPGHDQYVHMHSNRLSVVGAAPSHPLMRETITAVEFTNNVLDSRVSGKKKRGGQFLLPETILCHVRCASGASYALRSCIRGTLLEVNERVARDPTLLQRKPESDGYLVIVQPKTTEVMEIQEALLSKDEHALFRAAKDSAKETPVEETPVLVEAQ